MMTLSWQKYPFSGNLRRCRRRRASRPGLSGGQVRDMVHVAEQFVGHLHQHSVGAGGDVPVSGDYDSDGKSDAAVWRPTTASGMFDQAAPPEHTRRMHGEYLGTSLYRATTTVTARMTVRLAAGQWCLVYSAKQISRFIYFSNWGTNTDIPVPGDYDGDGEADVAVFRPGTGVWYMRKSSARGRLSVPQWGTSSDIPVPGDYDADGKADIAVWRPGTGVWYIRPQPGRRLYGKIMGN